MMTYKDWKERVIRWLTWAAFFSCIGCILHFTNIIPVNKKLWYVSKKKKKEYCINWNTEKLLLISGHYHSYS